MRALMVAALMLVPISTGSAEDKAEDFGLDTAREFLANCDAQGDATSVSFGHGYCLGVIRTVVSINTITAVFKNAPLFPLCVPSGVTLGDVRLVFIKYMEDHPEELHLSAIDRLVKSISEAYPCRK